MTVNRSWRYRLAPTPAQAEQLAQIAGVCRFVYNLAWEQRHVWWRQYRRNTGRALNYYGQSAQLTALRAEVDWIEAAPRDALDQALRDLHRAFDNFFAGRGAYPTPRKRSQGCGFTVRGRGAQAQVLNAKWARVFVPKVGWITMRLTRPVVGRVATISIREEAGHWYASLDCEIEHVAPAALAGQVGIDRGVTNALALSTGEVYALPAAIAVVDRRRRKAQRVLARRVKGSRRRAKQAARVASLHARARRMRGDWLHRASTDIARRFGLVAIEALNIKGMTASAAGTLEAPGRNVAQKRGLNRSILAQGWGSFERMLAYKLEATGGALIRVPAPYTSQTCSACGVVDARSRKSQAVFECVACGHRDHADINAAKEILRRSTSAQLVEGARKRPREARTMEIAA